MHHGVHLPMEEDMLGIILVVSGSTACRVGRPCALPDIELVIFVFTQAYRPRRAGIFALHMLASSPQTRWFLSFAMPLVACCRHRAGTFPGTTLVYLPGSG